jgi:hypothetical protein
MLLMPTALILRKNVGVLGGAIETLVRRQNSPTQQIWKQLLVLLSASIIQAQWSITSLCY